MIFHKLFMGKCVLLIHLLCHLHFTKCNEFVDKLHLELWYRSSEIGPCSDYFRYLRVDDFIIGNLTLPNMKIGDTVKLVFHQNHANFNGSLLLDTSSGDVINRVQDGLPLYYRVDFPPANFVPRLTNISINGNVLCATQFNDFDHCSATLVLQHTLEVTNNTLFTHNINIPNFEDGPTCGIIDAEIANKGASTSAYEATTIRRGEYPWLVSIDYGSFYLVVKPTGSLLSSKFVLSAASAIYFGEPESVVITLGRYDLTNMEEDNVVAHIVETLIYQPGYETQEYGAGLVLLKMKNPVTFTQFIKPICLWNEPADESLIINQIGVIVGWGKDGYGVPVKIRLNIVSKSLCHYEDYEETDEMNFICAESHDGALPCDVNMEGGLYLYRNGRWLIRGITANPFIRTCFEGDNNKYVDVAHHISWLKNNIDEPQPIINSTEEICGSTDTGSESSSKHPWLAAIYSKMYTGIKFSCTGALLSARSVLANADCLIVQGLYRISPDFFRIYIGRYDLNDVHQNGVTSRDVETLIYHPHFKPSSSNFQDNSIVILQMKTPVIFTQYVKPICLWKGPANQTEIIEQNATIAGWDVESSNKPISIAVNITSQEQCQTTCYNVSSSSKILCVAASGTKNHGILMMKQNERWLLRGMTSAKTFMLANFWVYSDIAEFQTWVQNNILP